MEADFLLCNILFSVELLFHVMRIEIVLYKNVLKSVVRNISVRDNTRFPAIDSLLEFWEPYMLVSCDTVFSTDITS